MGEEKNKNIFIYNLSKNDVGVYHWYNIRSINRINSERSNEILYFSRCLNKKPGFLGDFRPAEFRTEREQYISIPPTFVCYTCHIYVLY